MSKRHGSLLLLPSQEGSHARLAAASADLQRSRALSYSKVALLLVIMMLSAIQVHAVTELINPANQASLNNDTVSFDYYASMPGMTGCQVNLNGQAFPDTHAQSNTMNSVKIQNVPVGQYAWNVTCTNGTTETSATRTLTVDLQAPTLVVISPQNGTNKNIPLDIIPNDDLSPLLTCNISWNNQTLDSAQVARNTHYVKNYTGTPGPGILNVTCSDAAGNSVSQQSSFVLMPDFGLQLSMSNTQYGLTESPQLTINTIPGANVTVDICPDQPGFVQCTTALITNEVFPQTISLPYMNKTGPYIVDGLATLAGQTRVNRTTYSIINTISAQIIASTRPQLNQTFNLTAIVSGGIAPYHFTWTLDSGTVQDVSSVNIANQNPGTFTQYLTVTDQANNTKTINYTYVIDPVYSTIFQVLDNDTGQPVIGAVIDLTRESSGEEQHLTTVQGGFAYVDLQPGIYRMFTSSYSYDFSLLEQLINGSQTITIRIPKSLDKTPQVSVSSPANSATISSPVSIKYTATYTQPLTCNLFINDAPNSSMQVKDSSQQEFDVQLPDGAYNARISCTDNLSHYGSAPVSFTVTTAAASAINDDDVKLQNLADQFGSLLDNLGSYDQKEKDAISLIGYDKTLRSARKSILQAIRDTTDIEARSDLDAAGKAVERKKIMDNVDKVVAATPTSLTVIQQQNFVKYFKEPDLQSAAVDLAGVDGMTTDQNTLVKHLIADQEKFTLSTKLIQVEYTYPDHTQDITVVKRSFTYANNLTQYHIYEIIPKEVAQHASDLQLFGSPQVVKDDPVLKYDTVDSFTYIIPRKVDFTRLEDMKTIIAKPYVDQGITGFAILGDIGGTFVPLIILIVLIGLAYLVYYFELLKKMKFFIYNFGSHEQVHYTRVLINDVQDQLASNNYDKAELIYKEVRLTYDTLPQFAKNELYEDVMDLVHKMDAFYFNIVMLELDENIKAGNMEGGIACYEKLTHIYERLDPERQNQLISAVSAMGRRLGLGVSA